MSINGIGRSQIETTQIKNKNVVIDKSKERVDKRIKTKKSERKKFNKITREENQIKNHDEAKLRSREIREEMLKKKESLRVMDRVKDIRERAVSTLAD